MNPAVFASASPSVRSTDIKLQDVQRNMSKMTSCFIKLLSQLPNNLKTNGDHKDEKLAVIHTILDGIKMSRHANQNLVSIRKKLLLSGVNSEYKDLDKFAEDTHFHLFGEELEDSLKKAQRRHYSLQALKPKPPAHASTKRKFNETSKNDKPTKRPMTGHKGTPQSQYNSPSTFQQKKPLQTSETSEERKGPQIKKLRAEIDFSMNKMVSCHIPMETLRAEVEKFKGGNITNCFEKWANITQDQFVLNIVKFGLTMEFAEVPECQFVPPLNFSLVETKIINWEISKLLTKGVIVKTNREPNDYVSSIFTRIKKDGSYRIILNLKTFNEFSKSSTAN